VPDASLSTPQQILDAQRLAGQRVAVGIAVGSDNEHNFCAFMTTQHRCRGQLLLDEAYQSDVFAVVCSGVVKIIAALADGRQQIVDLRYQSDAFWRRYPANDGLVVEAATEVDLCCFSGEPFEAALRANASARHNILVRMLIDLDSARNRLLVLGHMTAMEKLTHFFMERLTKTAGHSYLLDTSRNNYPVIFLGLSRNDIADYLGLRIETVSRCFSELSQNGHIRLLNDGTVEICDPDYIRKVAECHERYPIGR
jgi:CRP/FNR family transcriptional regulator, anaerobic regulatory protein